MRRMPLADKRSTSLQTSVEKGIKDRHIGRIPKNISFIKPDVEAEANKSPAKKKKTWEDSPRLKAVREHKEECRKMAAQYRGDNDDKEGREECAIIHSKKRPDDIA